MWIFTRYGFFSVVNKTSDLLNTEHVDQRVEVRSRYKQHLKMLKDRFEEQIGDAVILGFDDPNSLYKNRDYEYRIIINAEDWVHLGAMLSSDVTYPNFKDEVSASCEEDKRLAATPYLEQLYSVYNSVQNDDRWESLTETIN